MFSTGASTLPTDTIGLLVGDPTVTPTPTPAPLTDETAATSPSTPQNNNSSVNETDQFSPTFTTPGEATSVLPTTKEEVNDTRAPGELPGGGGGGDDVVTTVAMTTAGTSLGPGYVILVLIILVIIVLCVILYFLRRVSRTYSFDLHRQVPANHLNEPIGTFEPVYLDDLERPASKDQVTTDDLSPPPISNGTTTQEPEEQGSHGDGAPQDQQDANGLETSPPGNASPSLGAAPADKTSSPLSSTSLFFDAIGEEQQNENNNNPSVCSSDPFVEINLDEPAWCAQLLTSPEAPSSVLPFSPFSFSSSSSSSP
ncbi:uncharacterized protein LOC131989293 [Centropristis striata]|uniref:uncharacterized protein LOC131989293 n=1 Tax=Centropristis striata TaxID=184440 RepID=UPI0027E19F12|nr:uncharacterized protein LOC131989293 [Centropristis striata]